MEAASIIDLSVEFPAAAAVKYDIVQNKVIVVGHSYST